MKHTKKIYHKNIENATMKNENYRNVVYTVPGSMQLVLMSLAPGEDIPREIHPHVTQFVRVESGEGELTIDYPEEKTTYKIKDGSAVVIPMGLYHYFKNTGDSDLKLYSIYTPPEHPSDRLQFSQEDSLNGE